MSEVFCAYCAQGVACLNDSCPVRAQRARDRNTLSGWRLDPALSTPDPLQKAVEELQRRTTVILTEQAKLLVREEVHAALKTLAPSPQDDPYWVGHRAGTEGLAEKDRELYAAQTELAEVRAQLQEAQAKIRSIERQHVGDDLGSRCRKCGPRTSSEIDELGHCKTCDRFVG